MWYYVWGSAFLQCDPIVHFWPCACITLYFLNKIFFIFVALQPQMPLFYKPQVIDEWVWSKDEIILTEKNRSAVRKLMTVLRCLPTYPTQTAVVSNLVLHAEKPVTNHLCCVTALLTVKGKGFPVIRPWKTLGDLVGQGSGYSWLSALWRW
jgi:hypothetical protein